MKSFSKILCTILILSMLVTAFASCMGDGSGETTTESETESNSETKESESPTGSESGESNESGESETETSEKLYHDTYGWVAVPMVTQQQLDQGFKGGEACQAVNYIYYVESDPTGQLVFFGTDVGDIYRSLDGGNNWQPCALGFAAAGGTSFAADPKNPNRILCLGTNAGQHDPNIIYISENAGESWKATAFNGNPKSPSGYRDSRDQIAFDPTSYDEKLGYCKTVYWARGITDNDTDKNGLYVSHDGGYSWALLKGTADYTNGYINVNSNGDLISANSSGLYIRKHGEKKFEKLIDKNIYSMDFIQSKDIGYCNTATRLYKTTDGGLTWNVVSPTKEQYNNKNLIKFSDIDTPREIRVSPVNTDRVIVFNDAAGYDSKAAYVSHDGGVTYTLSRKNLAGQWTPNNADFFKFSWSPSNENEVITTWCNLYKSNDGGKNFVWSCAGYNGICVGGMLNFNTINSDYVSFGSQDYNGGFSTDGGKTWKYMKWWDRGWGGFVYGSYALTDKIVVGGASEGSVSEGNGDPYLWITFDGGQTFKNTGKEVNGATIGCGSIHDSNIAFFGEYRTDNGGKTWTAMKNCRGVFTVDYKTGALFGAKLLAGGNVVVSTDEGVTWKNVIPIKGNIGDIAFDHESRTLYVASGSTDFTGNDYTLYKVTLDENYVATGPLQKIDIGDTNCPTGYDGVLTVCVDPNYPNIVYAGCGSNYHFDLNFIWRSMDAGKTWECLSRQVDDGYDGYKQGGGQPRCVRVNQKTGELFVFTACRGVWKISGPVSVYGEK